MAAMHPVAALLAAVALVGAPGVVPQHSVRGVRVGMTQAAVRRVLGAPLRVRHRRTDFGPSTTLVFSGLTVGFVGDGGASTIALSARGDRTARGVGVGSRERDVARLVPGARCLTESGYRHCYVGVWSAGHVVTDFAIRNGRVTRVVLGLVLD